MAISPWDEIRSFHEFYLIALNALKLNFRRKCIVRNIIFELNDINANRQAYPIYVVN